MEFKNDSAHGLLWVHIIKATFRLISFLCICLILLTYSEVFWVPLTVSHLKMSCPALSLFVRSFLWGEGRVLLAPLPFCACRQPLPLCPASPRTSTPAGALSKPFIYWSVYLPYCFFSTFLHRSMLLNSLIFFLAPVWRCAEVFSFVPTAFQAPFCIFFSSSLSAVHWKIGFPFMALKNIAVL